MPLVYHWAGYAAHDSDSVHVDEEETIQKPRNPPDRCGTPRRLRSCWSHRWRADTSTSLRVHHRAGMANADWIEKDSELLWRYRPSQVIDGNFIKPGRYTINSQGYRGPEFTPEKQPGIARIVCLGESNTFGLSVSDDAVWPRQMEKKLNSLDPQKRRWEVLNLAVTNYSTLQGVRQAREALPSLKPDIVMLATLGQIISRLLMELPMSESMPWQHGRSARSTCSINRRHGVGCA